MPSKQAIIDNIEQYSAEELFDYIQNEVVSFDELCNETEGFSQPTSGGRFNAC